MPAISGSAQIAKRRTLLLAAAIGLVLAALPFAVPLPDVLADRAWGFSDDEQLHAAWALKVAHDLHTRRLDNLAIDLWDQARWPPLHSLLQAPVILLVGPSRPAHRLANAIWLFPLLALVAVCAATAALETGAGRMAAIASALIASGAVASCPTITALAHAALIEIPGTAICLAAILTAASALRRNSTAGLVGAGLLAACAFFIKWPYGIPTLAAFAALLWAGSRPIRRSHAAPLFVPPLAVLALWLAWPMHLRELAMYLTWVPVSLQSLAAGLSGWAQRVLLSPDGAIRVALTLAGAWLLVRHRPGPLGWALLTFAVLAGLGTGIKGPHARWISWATIAAWTAAAAGLGVALARSPRVQSPRLLAGAVAVAAASITAAGAMQTRQLIAGPDATAYCYYSDEAEFIAATVPLRARLLLRSELLVPRASIEFLESPCYMSEHLIAWAQIRQHWDEPFSHRQLQISAQPRTDWQWWRVRRLTPLALLGLRRSAGAPRPTVPADYVASAFPAPEPASAQAVRHWLPYPARLELVARRIFPCGHIVTIYRILPSRTASKQSKVAG